MLLQSYLRRLLPTCIVLAMSLAALPHGFAQTGPPVRDLSQAGDYDIHNKSGWNGLATFAALAQGSGLQVEQRQQHEWGDLDNNDVLILLYPTFFVDPSKLTRFIRGGGRVLIADDVGAGAALFNQLGASRTTSIDADEFHDDQLFAPVARPVGTHALSQRISQLTTNHPGAITNLDEGVTSVFEFSGGETLVAVGELGQGRFVILTDPSVLINRMLQFEGNLEFAINLLRYLHRPGASDRVIILTRDIILSGDPHNRVDDGTWRGGAATTVSELDFWLGELNLWLFTASSLRIVTVLFAALLGVLAFLTLPLSRQRKLDGSWTRPGEETHRSLSETYQHAGSRTNYLLPAAIERDNVNLALEMALHRAEPLDILSEQELLSAAHTTLGLNTTKALKELLPRLRDIPQRAQAASHWEPRHLGKSEFEHLHKASTRFFDRLNRATDET